MRFDSLSFYVDRNELWNIAGSSPATRTNNPRVAQLVEHGIEDPGVGGSTPSPRTIIMHRWISGQIASLSS